MKIEQIDGKELDDSSYKGVIEDVSYSILVEIFGQPVNDSFDGKTQANWYLEINGEKLSIYDWKYYGRPVETITRWNVGGYFSTAVDKVKQALGI